MTVVTTHKATQELGPCVVNNELVWSSASGLMTADPQTYGGCLRKWHFDQVMGLKEGSTAAQAGGTALHSEIENYILHDGPLGRLSSFGRPFIPPPRDPLVLVEFPIVQIADGRIASTMLTARGKRGPIPMAGHVDVYDHRALYVDAEGTTIPEAATLEVKDWKTTSSFDYAKTARELGDNLQMITYAEAGLRAWPQYEHGRMTHVYFRTRGTPESRLVTIRRGRAEIAARWEYAEGVVRMQEDAARETNPDLVEPNRKACDAYRGCPHRGRCSAYRETSLDGLYGKVAADFTKETTMGLLSSNPQILQQPVAPQPDMRAQLAQEEAAMRAQQAQQQAQMPGAQSGAQLGEACQRLAAYGFGFPSLGGNAAQAYAQASGHQVQPGFTYQGTFAPAGARRSLHTIVLNEPAHVFQLEAELAAERAQQAPAPVPQAPTPPAPIATQVYGGILPPGAPQSMPQLAMQQPRPAPGETLPAITVPAPFVQRDTLSAAPMAPTGYTLGSEPAAAPAAPARTRGRPRKSQDAAPEAVATAPAPAPPPPGAPVSQAASGAESTTPTGIAPADCTILINARGLSGSKSLAGYVDYINGKLAKMYSVTDDGKPGIQDVRCVPKTSVLAYGAWKGAVREVVKAEPPPPGMIYHLDTFTDELNEVVADALRVVADERGWMYVRGTR